MGISNQRFWEHWKNEQYDEALRCAVREEPKQVNRLQTMLFGPPDQLKQSVLVSTVSVGEFIYDVVMLQPEVVRGLDFARSEDLSSLFTLSQFASHIDTSSLTGDMAQLQGYVAEQLLAAELQAKGHEVEFPATSNQPGWDIIVDGQHFQVKNLANPDGVREHLHNYPDIPVYVNEELAPYFEGHPLVYVSSLSREDVLQATTSTLQHADGLLDFELPLISAAVSTIYNIKRVWHDDVSMNQAVFNVISDTSSRVVLGALGQKAGIVVGTMLFGPAGGITGAMLGGYTGVSGGGRLSSSIKRLLSKKQEDELAETLHQLVRSVLKQLDEKLAIKRRKLQTIFDSLRDTGANQSIRTMMEQRANDDITYVMNKQNELLAFMDGLKKRTNPVIEQLTDLMRIISRSGVHPFHYQQQLKLVQQASLAYQRKN